MAVLDLPDQCARVAFPVTGRLPGTIKPVHAAKGVVLARAVAGFQVSEGIVATDPDTIFFLDALLPIEVSPGEVTGEHRRDLIGIDIQAVFDLVGATEGAGGDGID